MHVIVGLGNPGKHYANHRHNVGFRLADRLAECNSITKWQDKFGGMVAEGLFGKHKILLIKPQSFMNNSGFPVAQLVRYYKVKPTQVTVIHDDLDLLLGKIRVKQGGGHGGHNGLKNIDSHIGIDYWRVRVGIGRPPKGMPANQYVLANFNKTEKSTLHSTINALVGCWPRNWNLDEANKLMNAVSMQMKVARDETTSTVAPVSWDSTAA